MKREPQHSGATTPKHIDNTRATKNHPPKFRDSVRMDMFHSRPLRPKEKNALLDLLHPGQDDETRCAAAHVILRLGIQEAVPRLKEMRATAPPIVQSAFDLAIRFMRRMETNSEVPHPDEHLGLLMMMRNSNKSLHRHYAEIVLQEAKIMYGTPLIQPDLNHPRARGVYETTPLQLLGELDYAFRADAVKANTLPERIRRQLDLEPKKR